MISYGGTVSHFLTYDHGNEVAKKICNRIGYKEGKTVRRRDITIRLEQDFSEINYFNFGKKLVWSKGKDWVWSKGTNRKTKYSFFESRIFKAASVC